MNMSHHMRSLGVGSSDAVLEIQDWRAAALDWCSAKPTPISLAEVRQWDTEVASPAYKHSSGMFFSVAGFTHSKDQESCWTSTVMIDQPEVGLLGLAVSQSSNGMAALVQAKAEPGTIGGVQISPTVQATRSNQVRAHGGRSVPLLDLFRSPRRVILNSKQSEHGSVFWQKNNGVVIIEVPRFEPPHGFRWVEIADLIKLISVDHLVHSDLRTIISLGPFWLRPAATNLATEIDEIQRWLGGYRFRNTLSVRRVPLNDLEGWSRNDYALRRLDGTGHEIVGVRVHARGREVDCWDQLMVKPCSAGLVALAVREREGNLQALVRVSVETGTPQFAEIGPTVQIAGGGQPTDQTQKDLALQLSAGPGHTAQQHVYYDGLQSDEGGRFFQSEVRYIVVYCDVDPPSEQYRWCDVRTLATIARFGNQLNMQARDAMACLLSGLNRFN
jgi:oxidase EvaA